MKMFINAVVLLEQFFQGVDIPEIDISRIDRPERFIPGDVGLHWVRRICHGISSLLLRRIGELYSQKFAIKQELGGFGNLRVLI